MIGCFFLSYLLFVLRTIFFVVVDVLGTDGVGFRIVGIKIKQFPQKTLFASLGKMAEEPPRED